MKYLIILTIISIALNIFLTFKLRRQEGVEDDGVNNVMYEDQAGSFKASPGYDLFKDEAGEWSYRPHEGRFEESDSIVITEGDKVPIGSYNIIFGRGAGKNYIGSYSVIVGVHECEGNMLWLVDWNEPYLNLYPGIKLLLMDYERDVIIPGFDSKECRVELMESVKQELNR